MLKRQKTARIAEFGDFQTPDGLAADVCNVLKRHHLQPAAVIEPTCGEGSFLLAALSAFPTVQCAVGMEINPRYVQTAQRAVAAQQHFPPSRIETADFFAIEWPRVFADLPEPLLVIGNPPWVTNAELGALRSANLPEKFNYQKMSGLDALTGKSNFDISEWMLLRMLHCITDRKATLAMLCKTVVARKVLVQAWRQQLIHGRSEIRRVDAGKHFGASVDACLLLCGLPETAGNVDCHVYEDLSAEQPSTTIGLRDGHLVANTALYEQCEHLIAHEISYRWRSGIKHDCSRVMELRREGDRYRNGFGQVVQLEDEYLYPMLKGSEIANGRTREPTRWMLVTQRQMGDDTRPIRDVAPRTWAYLMENEAQLNARASTIYRNRPKFSVFGVGAYTFSPWKVAVSGLYKRPTFTPLGSHLGKPIVLDDTANFLPCQTKDEAHCLCALLNSDVAKGFFAAFAFWDSKRPVTVDLLNRLDLEAVADELGTKDQFFELSSRNPWCGTQARKERSRQLNLFESP